MIRSKIWPICVILSYGFTHTHTHTHAPWVQWAHTHTRAQVVFWRAFSLAGQLIAGKDAQGTQQDPEICSFIGTWI